MPPSWRGGAPSSALTVDAPVRVDMARVKARMDQVVLDARQGLEDWLGGTEGVTVVRGHARFRSAHAVEVGAEVLEAERVFVNVGGRAAVPDLPGVERIRYPDQQLAPRARSAAASIWWSSAAAMSGSSSPRSIAASGRR